MEYLKPIKWLICVCVIIFSMSEMFRIGRTDKNWSLRLTYANWSVLIILSGINALCIISFSGDSYVLLIMLSIFAGCILAAAVMDWWEQMVYRFVWWAAGMVGMILLLLKFFCIDNKSGYVDFTNSIYQLCFYIVLQQIVFACFYGRADSHAFSVCAIMLTFMGQTFLAYICHMTVVFGGLALVQFVRGNVKLNGNLKEPVPLVPYIVAAFWVWVDFTVGRC